MFAIILSYKKPLEEIERVTAAHRAYLDEHYAKGVFVLSGRQTNQKGGVILAQASSKESLEQVLALDPFSTEGIADYAIYEFTPTKAQPALKALIETA